jgi:hypothetical protein
MAVFFVVWGANLKKEKERGEKKERERGKKGGKERRKGCSS